MADPLTLAAVGAVALTEGITFLYGQAGDALKRWRESKAAKVAAAMRMVARPAAGLLPTLHPPTAPLTGARHYPRCDRPAA